MDLIDVTFLGPEEIDGRILECIERAKSDALSDAVYTYRVAVGTVTIKPAGADHHTVHSAIVEFDSAHLIDAINTAIY